MFQNYKAKYLEVDKKYTDFQAMVRQLIHETYKDVLGFSTLMKILATRGEREQRETLEIIQTGMEELAMNFAAYAEFYGREDDDEGRPLHLPMFLYHIMNFDDMFAGKLIGGFSFRSVSSASLYIRTSKKDFRECLKAVLKRYAVPGHPQGNKGKRKIKQRDKESALNWQGDTVDDKIVLEPSIRERGDLAEICFWHIGASNGKSLWPNGPARAREIIQKSDGRLIASIEDYDDATVLAISLIKVER
jgi:hypothetical protein